MSHKRIGTKLAALVLAVVAMVATQTVVTAPKANAQLGEAISANCLVFALPPQMPFVRKPKVVDIKLSMRTICSNPVAPAFIVVTVKLCLYETIDQELPSEVGVSVDMIKRGCATARSGKSLDPKLSRHIRIACGGTEERYFTEVTIKEAKPVSRALGKVVIDVPADSSRLVEGYCAA